MFAKLEVNGPGAAPLYRFLKDHHPDEGGGEDITWNFTKFLVGADGAVLQRFAPKRTPEEIAPEIARLLPH
jgi:glutathione peroxidase